MKEFLIFLLVLFVALVVVAEPVETDSIATRQLQEVVIQAPKVIRKADMDVYHPSKSAVENSKNGMQLLTNLMIPSLTVSDVLGTIEAAGQSVQVRINGRESSIDQVRSLLPETIKRVEWIDNPGLRYGGANYVLNIIVTNPTVGGSLQLAAQPALATLWGFCTATAKFNSGYSQWEVGANLKLTDKLKGSRDFNETFTFPDGQSLTRRETSLGADLDNTFGRAGVSYSYVKSDTTVFMADLGVRHTFANRSAYYGMLTLSDGSDDLRLTDITGDRGSTPYMSLYWQQNFGKSNLLVVNLTGSYYQGRSFADHVEELPLYGAAPIKLTDIHTDIHDRNQAYVVEADYIRNWTNGRLTVGGSYSANRNRSEYRSMGGDVFHQRQDRGYLFAEYFHRFGRWTLTGGMGVQYTDYLFRETNQGEHTWSPRPQATVTYSINSNHNFRLNFTSWQSYPSLAETNIVAQQLDGFQWRKGNPDLKTANSYMLVFRYGFNLPRVNGIFGVRAFKSPNAITPYLYWDDDRLITSYENSRGLENLSFFFAPQIDIIPGWMRASGYVQFRMERMRGHSYSYRSNAWSGSANIAVMHWGFVLSGMYVRAQRDLWGEKISWGEDMNLIDLSYNWKSWQFSAGIIMPFGRYDQGSRSLSRWNRNEQHTRLDMRMPYISINYNLQWGRQKRSANKLINADANADKSTTGTR